jgi:branched-chain amino acid transport system substrate-binding protein
MLTRVLVMLLAALLAAPLAADAQKPIKVGFPMILSGPGALYGDPALKGAQMFVEEINAKGACWAGSSSCWPATPRGAPTRPSASPGS